MSQINAESLEPTHRKVLRGQMEAILNFLEDHPQLVLNKCRPMAAVLWTECADVVNAVPSGPVKTGQQWSKYFSDWKYRIRRKALELKAVAQGSKPPEEVPPLTPLEEKLLRLIGDKSLETVAAHGDTRNTESGDEEDFCVPLDPTPANAVEAVIKEPETPDSVTCSKPSETSDSRKRPRPETPKLETEGEADDDEELDINDLFSSDQESDDDEIPNSSFFKLEERKLAAIGGIREELARAVDVITDIKDWLVDKNQRDTVGTIE